MIIDRTIRARAPLRLGLAGGGTDLSPYCDEFGGAVLNATIDHYAYAFISPSPDGRLRFVARDLGISECVDTPGTAQLRIHEAVCRRMFRAIGEAVPPLTVDSFVDAPPGSGLGSSSALVVALVEAFRTLLNLPLGLYDVAHCAYEVERIELGLPGGRQDQYAAAFGGINFIEFLANDRVIVNPLRVSRAVHNELQTSLVICFTGVSPSSEQIIAEQKRGMSDTGAALDSLHALKRDAIEMKQALLRGEIAHMAALLNRSWIAKKQTAHGISTTRIEDLHALALDHGALGGKVSGAGGGGFMMFIVPPQHRVDVIAALNGAGATARAAHFTADGAEAWIGEAQPAAFSTPHQPAIVSA